MIQPYNIEDTPNSSFSLWLGKRRTGKSTACAYFCEQLRDNKMIDIAFLFSPTDAGFDFIKPEYRFTDIEALPKIVKNMQHINEYNKCAPKRDQIKARILIIIDDHAVSLKDKNSFGILESLSTCGRHYAYAPCSMHICVLCQSLTKVPRVVRLNCDLIFSAQQSSRQETQYILDENFFTLDSSREGMRKGRALWNEILVSAPFVFCVIENFRQNIKEYGDYIKTYVAEL